MNWGTYIIIGMALAMGAVVTAGIYMVSHDRDSLEESDYYEKGLDYNTAYDQKENVLRKGETPIVMVKGDTLSITFKADGNQGSLRLRRPSNQLLDKTLAFAIPGRMYKIPIQTFERGAWQLQLTWKQAGIPFLYDQDLFFKAQTPHP